MDLLLSMMQINAFGFPVLANSTMATSFMTVIPSLVSTRTQFKLPDARILYKMKTWLYPCVCISIVGYNHSEDRELHNDLSEEGGGGRWGWVGVGGGWGWEVGVEIPTLSCMPPESFHALPSLATPYLIHRSYYWTTFISNTQIPSFRAHFLAST